MALRKTEIFSGEATINADGVVLSTQKIETVEKTTYCKVSRVNGFKEYIVATVDVIEEDTAIVLLRREYSFVPDLEGPNFIKQAYEHLKALPEFAGAEDC